MKSRTKARVLWFNFTHTHMIGSLITLCLGPIFKKGPGP